MEKDGEEVDGKSILGLMMLAVGHGSKITITAEGKDEQEALNALEDLISASLKKIEHSGSRPYETGPLSPQMIQEPISTEETWLQGIPVSPGIALGKIKIQISGSKEPVAYDISPEEVDSELVRFHRALQTTADQIRTLRERMIQISGEKDASIFDAHILLLQDKIILQQVQTELLKRLQNVEHIFYVVMQNYMEVLRRVTTPTCAPKRRTWRMSCSGSSTTSAAQNLLKTRKKRKKTRFWWPTT